MKTKPISEFRFGNIKAAVWQNKAGESVRYNVTFTRRYKDGEEWKSSDSFGRDDLPKLILAAQQAYESMFRTAKPSAPRKA